MTIALLYRASNLINGFLLGVCFNRFTLLVNIRPATAVRGQRVFYLVLFHFLFPFFVVGGLAAALGCMYGLRGGDFLYLIEAEERGHFHEHTGLGRVLNRVSRLFFLGLCLLGVLPDGELDRGFLALLDDVAESLPAVEGVDGFGHFKLGSFRPRG